MAERRNLTVIQVVATVLAYVVLIVFAFDAICAKFDILRDIDILNSIIGYIKTFGTIAVCGLVVLDSGMRRSVPMQVFACILIALVVVFEIIKL